MRLEYLQTTINVYYMQINEQTFVNKYHVKIIPTQSMEVPQQC